MGKGVKKGVNSPQGLDILAQQEVRGDIEGIPEEQITHIQHLPVPGRQINRLVLAIQRAAIRNRLEQGLDVALEAVQIADAVLDELRPDQLAAGVPAIAVGGEDAVAQEVLELLVEGLSLAVVGELRGQDGLDVLRVGGHEGAAAEGVGLARVLADGREEALPELHVLVLHGGSDDTVDEVDG